MARAPVSGRVLATQSTSSDTPWRRSSVWILTAPPKEGLSMDRLGKAERDRQFTDYVTSSRAQLRRTAYLLCGDWHLAEDLVQTTLSKLYVAWPRLHKDSTPDAFARRVLVRAHIDETRRPWNRRRARQEPADDAARQGLPVEDRDALMQALAELPPG